MGDLLIGLGIALAVLGPLMLIPVIWLLSRFALKPFFGSTAKALTVSTALVFTALVLTYVPGQRAFDDLCAAQDPPLVFEQVRVDGFFRTQLFPYEAVIYLTQGGFEFVEAPNPYKQDATIRYSKALNGEVRQDDVTELLSRYGMRETYDLRDGVSVTEKVIYEIGTGRELGCAANLSYQGGPLAIFLGTFGMASCPDLRTERGSKDFQIFYDLESYVLQAKPLP